MINLFFTYAILWVVILIAYSLKWSDLCITEIDFRLMVFLIFVIISSLIVGLIFKKNLKFKKLEGENPHKTSKITVLFILFFIVEFIYSKGIPLFKVLQGTSYGDVGFNPIPIFHMTINSFGILYSFYLSYIYICFKNKKNLYENILVVLIYVLCVARQNILICVLEFVNLYIASYFSERKKTVKNKIIIIGVLVAFIILYLFGVIGNMRYGSMFEWNDSSMICELGEINENYPAFLPKEFFWSYIYLATPLANLNYNISNFVPIDNLGAYFTQFIPNFISNKIFTTTLNENLLVSSLNVSTEFAVPYLAYGMFGVYFLYFVKLILCALILCSTYKRNNKYFIVVTQGIMYFFVFSFFDNTFTYSITAFVLIYCIMISTGKKIKIHR